VKVSLEEASQKVLVIAVIPAQRNEMGTGSLEKVGLCA
jgi:hypothetical protein